ncbi:MAG TPA: N-6 DNA methylase [Pyrinomonadaceae bacterium]|nr:N-6 DNA methylase [Pyrinomonadaceae bacterium]
MKTLALQGPSRRYKEVTNTKADGATFTPASLAEFVASQLVKLAGPINSSARLKALDPAVGEGALLIGLLNELRKQGIEDLDVYGFETNERSSVIALERLKILFPRATFFFSNENFLDFADRIAANEGSLFASDQPRFDLIIANPPYVRTQVLGSGIAQKLARHYGLTGRVDLYYAFVLAMGWVLSERGTAGIIVSNRFMTTRSGAALRKAILETLLVAKIWDLGDTKLFNAAVLPAVMLLQHHHQSRTEPNAPGFTTIYETQNRPVAAALDPIDALRLTGSVSVPDGRCFRVQHGVLNVDTDKASVWTISTSDSDSWLTTVKAHTWGTFSDIGDIRVGIKTCADKVFIRSDWNTLPEHQRPELLLPLTTHHAARRFKADANSQSKMVLYPHTVIEGRRKTIDLRFYPKTKSYLETHYQTLLSRNYVTEAGRQWYEIWVPQDPDAWSATKLVFRDISEKPTFWVDQKGTVVNGDCYWLTPRSHNAEDLLWLALAVSNSTFIEDFYDHSFNNKLYAGRRRFITQYVERFPLPDPSRSVSRQLIMLSKKIYEGTPSEEASSLEASLNELVWTAFGLPFDKDRSQSKKVVGSGI